MNRPPRGPKESILTRHYWLAAAGYGLLITCCILAAFELALVWLGMDMEHAVTVSFLTMAAAQLLHVFNMRDYGSHFLRNDIASNPYIWGAVVLCGGMLAAAVYVPGLAGVLKVQDPGLLGWFLIAGMATVTWAIGQLVRSLAPKRWN
jgi:Ca2+-transporting ATPase